MDIDGWSGGVRDGDRWEWRRDPQLGLVEIYDQVGNVTSSRQPTPQETAIRARATATANARAAIAQLVTGPPPTTLPGLIARQLAFETRILELLEIK